MSLHKLKYLLVRSANTLLDDTGEVVFINPQHACARGYTVEPLKEDPPRKGHCIKYLSTKDKNKSPNLSLPINIMQLEPLRRGQPL